MPGKFLRFSLVGTAGFVVDATTLYLCLWVVHLNPYVGRLISYLFAGTATWCLNRVFTFPDADRNQPHLQWAKFVTFNTVGGAVNYLIYALIIASAFPYPELPLLAVAAGSTVGLVFNFTVSRTLIFR